MKTDDSSNSSNDEVPGPADDAKQAPDNGSDSAQRGEGDRKSKDESKRVYEGFPPVSFRISPHISDHEGNGREDAGT